ncbi:MAG TPA: hypothetical protein P5309_09380 [Syntrophomonadaceae bacterium]|nr:hypothetical protein [Syntrophomonadaceae bacterium]
MNKKWVRLVLVVLSIFVVSVVVSGCGKAAEKASEKATEKAIESATGGQAQVDLGKNEITVKTDEGTTKIGGTNEWPGKIPSDVPKFSAGKITSIVESTPADGGYQVMVGIEGASKADVEKYKEQLESAGWKITNTAVIDNGYMVSAEKDNRSIVESFSADSDNNLAGGIYYTEEAE